MNRLRLIECELYFVGKNGKNEPGPRRWVPNEEEQKLINVFLCLVTLTSLLVI